MNIPQSLSKRATVLVLISIIIITFLCFSPVLSNDYVNYDDLKYVVLNPAIKDLSPDSLKAMFTTVRGQQYHYIPLTLLSFSLEYKIHNLVPRIYHANNLFLHVLNTVFVYWLIWVLFRQWALAGCVALLFGVHPMHVESVAWISERKDVLYAFFYLSGLVAYTFYVDKGRRRYLLLAFTVFVLSLLSKPMAVTFPLILLILDYLKRRKADIKLFIEKVPFFFLSGTFAVITLFEKDFPIIEYEKSYSWLERFFLANYNLLQYVIKSILPLRQSAFYPLPERVDGMLPVMFSVAPVFIILILAVFAFFARQNRLLAFGGLFFLGSIFLVLNFFPLGNILMAERYTYLSYIGLFIILAQGFLTLLKSARFSRAFKKILASCAVLWCAVLCTSTYQRCYIWSNSETLWVDVIEKYPQEPFAYYNLADYYVRTQRIHEAVAEYTKAIEADPNYFSAYNNRANLELVLGNNAAAERGYLASIQANPKHRLAYLNLAGYYASQNRVRDAVDVLDTIIELDPDFQRAVDYRANLKKDL